MDIGSKIRTAACFIALIVNASAIRPFPQDGKCPPENLIDPCDCKDRVWFELDGGSVLRLKVVQCINFTRAADLDAVMVRSGDQPVTNFFLKDSSLPYLPSAILLTKKTEYVVLEDTVLTSLFDQAPGAENSVTNIQLLRTKLKQGVEWNLLQNLRKLIFVKLQFVEVSEIGESFSDYINRDLIVLALMSTKTNRIENEAFRNLTRLRFIIVSDCLVTNIQRSMFAHPSPLTVFDFSGNYIQNIPTDMFDGMPYIQDVSLKGNRITTFSEVTFGSLWNSGYLNIINMKGNPLECTCSTQWILTTLQYEYHFRGNCNSPTNMTGKDVGSLIAKDFLHCSTS